MGPIVFQFTFWSMDIVCSLLLFYVPVTIPKSNQSPVFPMGVANWMTLFLCDTMALFRTLSHYPCSQFWTIRNRSQLLSGPWKGPVYGSDCSLSVALVVTALSLRRCIFKRGCAGCVLRRPWCADCFSFTLFGSFLFSWLLLLEILWYHDDRLILYWTIAIILCQFLSLKRKLVSDWKKATWKMCEISWT